MPRRTCLIIAIVALSLCCLATACFAAEHLDTGDSGASATTLDETTDITRDVAKQSTERVPGGAIRLAGALPPTLDPALVQDATSAEYIVHLYSGLVRLNAYLTVVPDLASWWEIDDSGRTYTFYLRDDIVFANGRDITSEDIVYSIERACSPEMASPVALSYLSDIIGVQDYARGETDHIAGLKAVSDDIVEMTIDAPKAYFLARLSYPVSYVVDREQVEQEGDRWMLHPNGSGPFVLESLTQETIVLAPNGNYYGRPPSLDRVEYILQGGYAITMYENDELDLVQVPPSEMERMLDPENPLSGELHGAPELSVTYVGFDVTTPPFADLAVRQAFAQAIDRDKIADLVLQGTASAAHSILPPGMPDHDEDLDVLPYDPDRARNLLAGSDYGAGNALPEIVLATSGTSGYMDSVTAAIVTMLEDNLDVRIQVHQVEWSDFLRDLNQQRYQMYIAGWIADYPDSENFLDLLFHSQSNQNHTGYANAEVDDLVERARVESDSNVRASLYHQAECLILSDAPWIPLTHGMTWTLVKPEVHGFEAMSAVYPWLQDLYLDQGN